MPIEFDEAFTISKILQRMIPDEEFLKKVIGVYAVKPLEYDRLLRATPSDAPPVEVWESKGSWIPPRSKRTAYVRRLDGMIIDASVVQPAGSVIGSRRVDIPEKNMNLLLNPGYGGHGDLSERYPTEALPAPVTPSAKPAPPTEPRRARLPSESLNAGERDVVMLRGAGAAAGAWIVHYIGARPFYKTHVDSAPAEIPLYTGEALSDAEFDAIPQVVTSPQGGGRRKTARRSRMGRRRTQRGGAAMPLAWYQQGAQFQGTTADPTGVGLAGSSANWARSALQAGGRRRRTQRRAQHGGFVPSVMGAGFADVGMRLLPAAAYMGYNQFDNYRKQQRKTRRRR